MSLIIGFIGAHVARLLDDRLRHTVHHKPQDLHHVGACTQERHKESDLMPR